MKPEQQSQQSPMSNIAYTSNGVPIETGVPTLIPYAIATRKAPTLCCGCGDPNTLDALSDPNDSQIFVIRILAVLCIIFGATELGIGLDVYLFLSYFRPGAWWSVLLVLIAAFVAGCVKTRRVLSMTIILAGLAIIVSVIGTVADATATAEFSSLTACATQTSLNSNFNLYGSPADYSKAQACSVTASKKLYYAFNDCYCTDGGSFCGDYTLSEKSIKAGRNCGDILMHFTTTLTASTILCGISCILVIILAIVGCVSMCCPRTRLELRHLKFRRDSTVIEISPAFGVTEATADSSFHPRA